jgi:hypothetical protein
MNNEIQDDARWHALLAQAKPTFAGASEPPYGFTTRMLARLRAEEREKEVLEKVGFRALFASFALLLAVGGFITVSLQYQKSMDLEPGVNGAIQAEYVSFT